MRTPKSLGLPAPRDRVELRMFPFLRPDLTEPHLLGSSVGTQFVAGEIGALQDESSWNHAAHTMRGPGRGQQSLLFFPLRRLAPQAAGLLLPSLSVQPYFENSLLSDGSLNNLEIYVAQSPSPNNAYIVSRVYINAIRAFDLR